jgi:hypothetical protein
VFIDGFSALSEEAAAAPVVIAQSLSDAAG